MANISEKEKAKTSRFKRDTKLWKERSADVNYSASIFFITDKLNQKTEIL